MEGIQALRKLPPVTTLLVAANFVVFFVLEMLGSTENGIFMLQHGALYGPVIMAGQEYYRLFTAMFLHFGASHLMHNMLMLFLIGGRLEQAAGGLKLLLIYLVSGIGANVFTVWFYTVTGTDAVSAGASGALMGVVGALFACILLYASLTDLDDFLIPKMTLQPLVENAIYHGIKPRRGGGAVSIRSAQEGSQVLLEVRDTGVGMSPEALQELNSSLLRDESSGFGVMASYKRLKLMFGDELHFVIDSREGEGTVVSIRIPGRMEEEP